MTPQAYIKRVCKRIDFQKRQIEYINESIETVNIQLANCRDIKDYDKIAELKKWRNRLYRLRKESNKNVYLMERNLNEYYMKGGEVNVI